MGNRKTKIGRMVHRCNGVIVQRHKSLRGRVGAEENGGRGDLNPYNSVVKKVKIQKSKRPQDCETAVPQIPDLAI
jgi:hypothetical protein